MFAVENHVGRLVEMRASALTSLAELEAYNARFRAISGRVAARQLIVCADYRQLRTLGADVGERFAQLLTAHNARVERGAIVCQPGHELACTLLERAVVRAAHPQRRAFRDSADAMEWLGGALTDDERNRLIDFLVPPQR